MKRGSAGFKVLLTALGFGLLPMAALADGTVPFHIDGFVDPISGAVTTELTAAPLAPVNNFIGRFSFKVRIIALTGSIAPTTCSVQLGHLSNTELASGPANPTSSSDFQCVLNFNVL